MFFDDPEIEKKQLPKSVGTMQTDLQDWFSGSSTGQVVKSLQDTAQQYQKNINNWFDQTSLGQGVNNFNNALDQRFRQMQTQEQAKHAAELNRIYDQALGSLTGR